MTTDPTRAALEALVDEAEAMRGSHGHRQSCDRDHRDVPMPVGLRSCATLTKAIDAARAALATPPAPEKRMTATERDEELVAITEALRFGPEPTPPAPEERCVRSRYGFHEWWTHSESGVVGCLTCGAQPTPPAPEPSAALVERLLNRLYPLTPNGRTGFAWKEYDATKADLDAIAAAARAEGLDGLVERLA